MPPRGQLFRGISALHHELPSQHLALFQRPCTNLEGGVVRSLTEVYRVVDRASQTPTINSWLYESNEHGMAHMCRSCLTDSNNESLSALTVLCNIGMITRWQCYIKHRRGMAYKQSMSIVEPAMIGFRPGLRA